MLCSFVCSAGNRVGPLRFTNLRTLITGQENQRTFQSGVVLFSVDKDQTQVFNQFINRVILALPEPARIG